MSSTNGAVPVVEADDAGSSSSPPSSRSASAAPRPTASEAEAFYLRHHPKIFKMLRLRGARVQEAEDAASDAICDAIRTWEALHTPDRWVYTTAWRTYLKYRRSVKGEVLTDDMAAVGPSVEDKFDECETQDLEQWFLSGVTATQQQIMTLLITGMSPREVATETGRSRDAVRSAALRARARLKALHAEELTEIPRQRRPRLHTGTDATAEEHSGDV